MQSTLEKDLITSLLWQRTPICMAMFLNEGDQNLVFFRSPWTLFQSHLITARSSHHFCFLFVWFNKLTQGFYQFPEHPKFSCLKHSLIRFPLGLLILVGLFIFKGCLRKSKKWTFQETGFSLSLSLTATVLQSFFLYLKLPNIEQLLLT